MSGLLDDLADIGRDPHRGGYSRHVFDDADRRSRKWFADRAAACGLTTTTDRNANLWAWWGPPGPDAVVTGSHLDSVPGGGAFDGPLGVASAFAAVDSLRQAGFRPARPVAVVAFAEEEGGRFGVPCLGSRLLTGAIDPDRARALRDADGTTFAEAMRAAGGAPEHLGRDEEALRHLGRFVELHVEQGRALDRAVGVARSIDAHGRWRFRFTGRGDHAGTARLDDRRDPMLPAAALVTAARRVAAATPDGRATVGRLRPVPGGTNVIASAVDVWLDARAPGDARVRDVVAELTVLARQAAADEGCAVVVTEESRSGAVRFDAALRDRCAALLDDAPALPTGAGHDAGVLAAEVPTAMLFVRNPTGISHAPQEHAEPDDCAAGVRALTRVLRELAAP
ncbi:allantoate amidohydrolase [Saccharopolyspora sp. CA-218241]|uniref:allantoate amidohydrolase n=1 Tax=Saccharopolyspora sp. CA-218241 TaxID=3240027 RepID=UPI003D9880EF